VAIDAHTSTSETFALVKKQKSGEEPPFILHFGQEDVYARLPSTHYDLKPIDPKKEYAQFRWALCMKSGRPHNSDKWELDLKKGQRVKVFETLKGNWHIVADEKGRKRYAHSSWLDFADRRLHRAPENAKAVWSRYSEDVRKMLDSTPISTFISMTDYVDVCTKTGCKATKEDQYLLGICVHDLKVLLGGSGRFCLEWVKKRRNVWHPDKFVRYCAPEAAGPVMIKAQQLFVLHGMLLEEF
jgi:methylenetetrahydrofolate dehydrogenase (NADP+)/methenyltetrahydrofolate cyclohydrolase/formyltetrahydrofolate synthetase